MKSNPSHLQPTKEKESCPVCRKSTTNHPKRICFKCQGAISQHQKYFFLKLGKYTVVQHRHCDNPFEYFSKKERRGYV